MTLGRIFRWFFWCLIAVLAFIAVANLWILATTKSVIYHDLAKVPAKQVALVPGARVYRSTTVSPILADRLHAAYNLYAAKKVQKIIVSGDHGTKYYDEVHAMRDYLLRAGVPAQDIFLDHAGFDTYDSVYRARDIFQAQSMIIVTQEFHLPRALFIAQNLGVDAVGLTADLQDYADSAIVRNGIREPLARVKAFLMVILRLPPTTLGDPIPVTGDGRVTDDKTP